MFMQFIFAAWLGTVLAVMGYPVSDWKFWLFAVGANAFWAYLTRKD